MKNTVKIIGIIALFDRQGRRCKHALGGVFALQKLQATKLAWMLILFAIIIFSMTAATCFGGRDRTSGTTDGESTQTEAQTVVESTRTESAGTGSTTAAQSGGGGGSRYSGPLVGHWFHTQEQADISRIKPPNEFPEYTSEIEKSMFLGLGFELFWFDDVFFTAAYSFMPEGDLWVASIPFAYYTATADTITINVDGGIRTYDYIISGDQLTIIERPDIRTGGLGPGTYYRGLWDQ